MGQGYAESIPQTTLEQILGTVAKYTKNSAKTLGNQFAPLGAVADFLTEGPASLLEDMSWGQSPLKPGGHGPNLDPRVTELPGAGSLMKMAKFAAIPALGYIRRAPNDPNTAMAMLKRDQGRTDEEIWDTHKVYTRDPGGAPLSEVSSKGEEYVSSNDLIKKWDDAETPEEMSKLSDMMTENAPYTDRVKNSVMADIYPEEAGRTMLNNQLPLSESAAGRYSRGSSFPGEEPGQHVVHTQRNTFPNWEKNVVEHETQHAISGHGNLTKGASMAGMKEEIINNLNKRRDAAAYRVPLSQKTAKDYHDIREIDNLLEAIEQPGHKLVSRVYRNVADEVRARFAPKRADLSQAELDADPFYTKLGDLKTQIQINPRTHAIQNKSALDDMINESLVPYKLPSEMTGHEPYMNPKYKR